MKYCWILNLLWLLQWWMLTPAASWVLKQSNTETAMLDDRKQQQQQTATAHCHLLSYSSVIPRSVSPPIFYVYCCCCTVPYPSVEMRPPTCTKWDGHMSNNKYVLLLLSCCYCSESWCCYLLHYQIIIIHFIYFIGRCNEKTTFRYESFVHFLNDKSFFFLSIWTSFFFPRKQNIYLDNTSCTTIVYKIDLISVP